MLKIQGKVKSSSTSKRKKFRLPLISRANVVSVIGQPYGESGIGSKFMIDRIIDRGGMSIVFSARGIQNNELVAVKCSLTNKQKQIDFLKREAQVMSLVDHENIVRYRGYGCFKISKKFRSKIKGMDVEKKLHFLAMEHVDGMTLYDVLSFVKSIHWKDIRDVFIQVCEGLGAIHSTGYISQDVKSENIFLIDSEKGLNVKVFDFGIARRFREDPLFNNEIAYGTPYFMSPEQTRGNPMDQRSDIYALGGLMFELLCGIHPIQHAIDKSQAFHPPEEGKLFSLMKNRMVRIQNESVFYEKPEPFSNSESVRIMRVLANLKVLTQDNFPEFIETKVRNIIIRAMQPLAENRFQSAKEMAEAIEKA